MCWDLGSATVEWILIGKSSQQPSDQQDEISAMACMRAHLSLLLGRTTSPPNVVWGTLQLAIRFRVAFNSRLQLITMWHYVFVR
jgi:hypothetical protein